MPAADEMTGYFNMMRIVKTAGIETVIKLCKKKFKTTGKIKYFIR